MIRIRPGRSWRHNPAYLRDLRAGTSGADILDVLGIELDGVDIAAGVGEAHVLVAVLELAWEGGGEAMAAALDAVVTPVDRL